MPSSSNSKTKSQPTANSKPTLQQILEKVLKAMASAIIKKHKPKIIGITGSMGKTTTKEAIFHILNQHFEVRKNEKNYNNEIGVPLTIIGAQSGNRSIFGWVKVFIQFILAYFSSNYPEILILEMGADRPGDLEYLCEFVPLEVGVVTNVGFSHLEFFKNKKTLAKEKSQIVRNLAAHGLAVLNFDNPETREMASQTKANVSTYGFGDKISKEIKKESKPNFLASDFVFQYKDSQIASGKGFKSLNGSSFKLNYKGKIIPVRMEHCLGRPQIYSALAALAVSEYFEINLLEAINNLSDFYPPSGRLMRLEGIKKTIIIDDSYNSSSPEGLWAALETLKNLGGRRRIAVLGDMLELGAEEKNSHREVGKKIFDLKIDFFVAVGKRMKLAQEEFDKLLKEKKEKFEKAVWFASPDEAKFFVQDLIQEGDLILVKGSQGMRMEKIVEEIMAKPELAKKVLARQDEIWKKKEFANF